jgi:selenocysteine lyase/cysteine desulfurase
MLNSPELMKEIRGRFAHVETCPVAGERVFFENAGGALTLNSVVETSSKYAAIPDNQGRDNPASAELVRVIDKMRADAAVFFNADSGQVFVGESGTELLFRMISEACLNAPAGGKVVGSMLEHPASRSAATRWAGLSGRDYVAALISRATISMATQFHLTKCFHVMAMVSPGSLTE